MSAVLVEKNAPVGRLVINRPEARNTLSAEVIAGLRDGLDTLEADPDVRVIVLTGAGDKAFCAGADLRVDPSQGLLAMHDGRGDYANLLRRFLRCGKVIVARVNGHALGGGLGLACACDIVVAADGATFGTPEIRVGLYPMMIMALLVRHVPRKKLAEMMLAGRRFPAVEAVELGLANYAVPAAELDAKVSEITGEIAAKSLAVLRLGKQAFAAMQDMSIDQALSHLQTMLSINATTEDAMEGVLAFMEKRDPRWKDK
ncbi:MAG: enoyl-CoA hydratase-related protein [Deltaproteobacteria bacterium]|nr:enoyl-CoA hydratase-related protein [Deltaproteobacteria bacterium]